MVRNLAFSSNPIKPLNIIAKTAEEIAPMRIREGLLRSIPKK